MVLPSRDLTPMKMEAQALRFLAPGREDLCEERKLNTIQGKRWPPGQKGHEHIVSPNTGPVLQSL
jgi:hypothetical protein